MASDWLPRDGQSLCEWAENLKVEFPGIASSLGFSAGEITAVLLDCNYCLFVCRAAADADSTARAWVQARETLLSGNANSGILTFPNGALPAQPAVAAPAPGILTRFRAFAKRVKGSPTYTPAVGQSLRIVGSSSPVDPASAKPKLRVKPLPMFQSELQWPRLSFSGAFTRSQRDGETGWTDHGIKTGNTFVDDRPLAEAGKPEVRRYQQIYVRNDGPVGLWSDVVEVTLQP